MKFLKLFENSVDYSATEDTQVSYLEDTKEVKYHKKNVVKITDIKSGDNLRGKKIYNTRLDLPFVIPSGQLATEGASVTGIGFDVGRLSYAGSQYGVQFYKGSGPSNNVIFYSPISGKFYDVVAQVPDDRDYIVKSNDLSSSTDNNWGWNYVVVE